MYRQKAIELAKKIAKIRDRYTCQRCGKLKHKSQCDGSHIIPVSARGIIAADPQNIITLCDDCHLFDSDSWHSQPQNRQWFDEKFPGLYYKLRAKHKVVPIKDWQWKEIYKKLREELCILTTQNAEVV